VSSTLTSLHSLPSSVLLRLDLDLPVLNGELDLSRLETGLLSLKHLLDKGVQHVRVIGHRGRPEGKKVRALSLKPVEAALKARLSSEQAKRVEVLENLRFDAREEANDPSLAKELAKGSGLFVNDAFASSHREHTSIVGVPAILPSVIGLHFESELKHLHVAEQPNRPFIVLIGGAKIETKLPLITRMCEKADVVLVGGKLIQELEHHALAHRKLIRGKLDESGLDISQDTVSQFERFFAMAKTIVWNGPMGKVEDGHLFGTQAMVTALKKSNVPIIIGGGDTEVYLDSELTSKSNVFVSSGGGAMLTYLSQGTVVGLEAIAKNPAN